MVSENEYARQVPLEQCGCFERSGWAGRLIAHGDVSTDDFGVEDVAELIASASWGDRWDGDEAAVFLLKDGRYACYESFYGPTGSGFISDAYGGNADIHFASTLEEIIRWGLTDESRTHLGISQPGEQSNIKEIEPQLVCGSCYNPPESHGDSDAGLMSVCPPRELLGALEASFRRAGIESKESEHE